MLDHHAKRVCTLAAGASGTGKTTFAIRYLLSDRKLSTRFIFDPDGEFSRRLKLPAADREEYLTAAAAEGFCLFDPGSLFPGQPSEAFNWFCQWVFDYSGTIPGRKLFVIDEAWKYSKPGFVPHSLALCINEGRKRGLELFFITQRPHLLNGSITNEVSELVCFRLQEPAGLARVALMGIDSAALSKLANGKFISLSVQSGRTLAGKLF